MILRVDFAEELHEVGSREAPVERGRQGFVVVLEAQQPLSNLFETREVAGREDLSLDNGEVDFDLVEPARVDRAMDRNDIGKCPGQTLDAARSTMRRAVVDDPEDASGIAIGRLAHDLSDEATEGFDARSLFAASEDLRPMHIERGKIGPCSGTLIFVFHPGTSPWARGGGRMQAHARLNAGLLVGADDELVPAQPATFPAPLVEIENAPGFAAKSGSRGKIQKRCCQGRMASSCNQRQTVVPLMAATMPRRAQQSRHAHPRWRLHLQALRSRMTPIKTLFNELKGEIETIADERELRKLWSGSDPKSISSPAEEVAHVFDDYQIDRILRAGREVIGVTESEFHALRAFREAFALYLEHIAPKSIQTLDWEEVLGDPLWQRVSLAAKDFVKATS